MTGDDPMPAGSELPLAEASFAGTPPFPVAARAALADPTLRANLRRATTTIRAKRARAIAERDDWEALRRAGAAVKDAALARLPELLVELEAKVTAAGGTIHWAGDAAEAARIVTELVRATGAREVVKVKSMTSVEIELNRALAGAGIAAWETDLAELIVQLGGDLPSHILVPAIHRNRAEVRAIFEQAMGRVGRAAPADLAAEPAALAEAARLHLREKFLRARVAISGANFAVAETGTIVVVESEGNGRMCLTLPDVLISIVGIEKLVPSWQDLEVLLALLARSATAERMSPYTSMWTGVTPGDGPRAFHLVLLDNGRTLTLADPRGRAALRCIRCSACLNVCPVYERTGGAAYGSVYPGPIGAILTPQLRGIGPGRVDAQTASLPFASTLCGACADVCPVRIDIPELLLDLRAKAVEALPRRSRVEEIIVMEALAIAFTRPWRFTALAWLAGRLGWLLGRRGWIGRLPLPGWAGAWLRDRDLVAPAPEPFRRWWRRAASRRLDPGSTGEGPPAARSRPSERGRPAPDRVRTRAVAGIALSEARATILARARAALADRPSVPDVPRTYRRALPAGTDPIERFIERVRDYRASVERVPSAELPTAIGRALAAARARRVAVPVDLPSAWLAAIPEPVVDDPALAAAVLDGVDGVVTGCAVAVAETGTIVLDGGTAQGRRALSLLPDLHVCVVRSGQIVGEIAEALEQLDPRRPLTWISGPSATSDIELERVEGVHGPRRLVVLIADEGTGP